MNKKTVLQSILALTLCAVIISCGQSSASSNADVSKSESKEDSLLNLVQYQTFQYFWEGAEPNSGMARERYHMDDIYPSHDKDIITSGGSGFGLMAIIVGIERGFITREQGVERFERITDFLENADTFHGVFPHWWDGKTGKAKAFSQKDDGGDLVESSSPSRN
jgi:hypothetical protein